MWNSTGLSGRWASMRSRSVPMASIVCATHIQTPYQGERLPWGRLPPTNGAMGRRELSAIEGQYGRDLLPGRIHHRVGAALSVGRDHDAHAADDGAGLLVDDRHGVLIDPGHRHGVA